MAEGNGTGNGGSGGNGGARASIATRIVSDPVITAIARMVQVVGLPLGAWLFLQVWNGLGETRTLLHTINTRLAVAEERARTLDRDQSLFNARLYALERAARTPEIQPSIVIPPGAPLR